MTKEEKLRRLRYNNIIIILLLLTWFARCWLGNAHDRSTACKTEDGRHRRPSRGLYLFMMLFCPGESRRKSLFVLRRWLRYTHIIIYNNFMLCTYFNPRCSRLVAVSAVSGERSLIANAVAQFRCVLRAEPFFDRTGRGIGSGDHRVHIPSAYPYSNTACRPAERRHLQPIRPHK